MRLTITTAALVALAAAAPASAKKGDLHISGQGRLLQERTFALNVFGNEDGTATGQVQLVRRDFPTDTPDKNTPIIEKVNVTCAHRVDDNTVVFGGVVERTNNTSLAETRYFVVRDNGTPNEGTDEMSYLIPSNLGADDPLFCLNLTAGSFSIEPILNGNITIKD